MSTVNDQVTDAITQLNALLSGGAAAQSMGMLDVTGTETIGMSMFNAVTAQQNAQTSASAAATASCAKMLNLMIPTPPPEKVLKPDDKKTIADLTHTIQALQKKEPAAASTTAGAPSEGGTDNASTK
ncbi:RebB family R body protein [Pseudoalteromonas sp. MMG024]|uniref:RebB family R body protein n=1 Tax=Pseudoalteromonas sp. MMG024 TaxID=2909980 RepID=UPI001F24C9BF|nr:RebB family R body protein [Pseudoalteromonas sp. MMG024]MCF6459134.1 RebB family R body protein [Pseudoalteromonas sp. MMG024]